MAIIEVNKILLNFEIKRDSYYDNKNIIIKLQCII